MACDTSDDSKAAAAAKFRANYPDLVSRDAMEPDTRWTAGKGLVRSQDDGGDDAVFAPFENTRSARREHRSHTNPSD